MNESAESVRRALEERISARDRAGALAAALTAVREGAIDIPTLYDALTAILIATGASWHDGHTSVWEEHYTSAVVRTIIESCAALVAERAAASNGYVVVFATPPDEYHELGLRMTADRFALVGWTVHYLGANVPCSEVAHAVAALGAHALVLSASTHLHRVELAPYVAHVREAHPSLRIWVGGPAFALESHGWPAEEVLAIADIPTLAERMG